jgi:hypothetical protein
MVEIRAKYARLMRQGISRPSGCTTDPPRFISTRSAGLCCDDRPTTSLPSLSAHAHRRPLGGDCLRVRPGGCLYPNKKKGHQETRAGRNRTAVETHSDTVNALALGQCAASRHQGFEPFTMSPCTQCERRCRTSRSRLTSTHEVQPDESPEGQHPRTLCTVRRAQKRRAWLQRAIRTKTRLHVTGSRVGSPETTKRSRDYSGAFCLALVLGPASRSAPWLGGQCPVSRHSSHMSPDIVQSVEGCRKTESS